MTDKPALTVGDLRQAITDATENGGAWGQNLGKGKSVLLRLGNRSNPLRVIDPDFAGGICLSGFTGGDEISVSGLDGALERLCLESETAVYVWVGGRGSALSRVSCAFEDGSFWLALDGDTE